MPTEVGARAQFTKVATCSNTVRSQKGERLALGASVEAPPSRGEFSDVALIT